MSKVVKLKKGFDINLAGKPKQELVDFATVETFAVKPTDFIGFQRPKVLVNVGDTVQAGTPIMIDKAMDQVIYAAPVSGEVIDVKRGERRKLLEIVIKSDGKGTFANSTPLDVEALDRDALAAALAASGTWPNIIQRPFGIVANPADIPKAIFISGFDTHPLAPDYGFALQGQAEAFQAGIDALAKLTCGKVHLNLEEANTPDVFAGVKNAEINKFSGPHPVGNVGVQIHHLDPINKGEVAWTLNPAGVVQIGKFVLGGVYDASKIIAITGSELTQTAYVKTISGACVSPYVKGNLNSGHVRVISGNVLTGEKIPMQGFLGFYHNQITVIPEGDYYEFLGWAKPTTEKLSYHRALGLLSFLTPKKEFVLDSNGRGEERAFVQTGVFESVTPMDVLPVYLLKAIMAEDFDEMEELGIYEVIEEDLALCEFVDVSKHPVQELVRKGIELIQYS